METLVRVKRWRGLWSVECWGLQHSVSFTRAHALDAGAAVVRSLLIRGEPARLVVEESSEAGSASAGKSRAA